MAEEIRSLNHTTFPEVQRKWRLILEGLKQDRLTDIYVLLDGAEIEPDYDTESLNVSIRKEFYDVFEMGNSAEKLAHAIFKATNIHCHVRTRALHINTTPVTIYTDEELTELFPDVLGPVSPNEAEQWEPCEDFRLPPSLCKAVDDCFQYALKLKTGEIIQFESATVHGDWVSLHGDGASDSKLKQHFPFPIARQVDVRIEDILWCIDAPFNS